MKSRYLTFGVALVVFLAWANHRGWRPFNDLLTSNSWAPRGQAGFHK